MKHRTSLLLIGLLAVALSGCAASRLTTRIATSIGSGYLASRDNGVPEMRKLIKAWPYASGQIKAIPHYDEEVPQMAKKVIDKLDEIAKQDTELSDSECGATSVDFVLVEYYSIKFGWDKYGVSIVKWARAALGI